MLKNKKDVDRHVRTALSKLRSETEKNLRGFPIAKLYYKINEFSTAQHFISSFLSVKEDCAPAHKLLGHCYLQLKKPDKALASFQRSLQLEPKQHDLLIEICKLLLEDDTISPNKAKYWCDLAEAEKIHHDAVLSLRLKLLNKNNMETKQVEELIQKEISSRPNDANLRIRLIRLFLEQNRIVDAFKYAFDLQMKNHDLFLNCGEWYNVVSLVLNKYKQLANVKKTWEFWFLLTICCEKQVEISFTISTDTIPNAGTTETANLLFNFDQCLYEAYRCVTKLCQEQELATEFLRHYRGQLCLYAAAIIFKREIVQNKNQWQETSKNALPLLLLAFQCGAPDPQELWLKHSRDQTKQLIQFWNREGAFRCAQAGRTLLSYIEGYKDQNTSVSSQVQQVLSESRCWTSTDDILAQARQYCADNTWRNKLFRILFPNSDLIIKMQSSLLINCQQLDEPNYEIPSYADVESYEEIAQYLKPQSLHNMVYLCLGSENLADIRCKFFSGLNFSTQNLAFCGAESLNQLDIDTFLYGSAIQAQRNLEVEKNFSENYTSKNFNKPKILPFVNISSNLCTEEQMTWWLYAYQVYKNLTCDNLADIRATLQYGIEAVRGINGPKIDLIIVLKLGKLFLSRSQDHIKPMERNFLEARAENLYKYGLNMLKLHNKGVLEPYRKLLKYSNANSTQVEREINTLAEEAITHLAARYFKNSEFEECIEELTGIQLPFATYFQAEAYRKLDESNKTPKKTKKIFLEKARDCLSQTLNLLQNSNISPNHPLNSIVHSEIKRLQYTNKFTSDGFTNGLYPENGGDDLNDTPTFQNNNQLNQMQRNSFHSSSLKSVELENLVKQMASTLTFLKDEFMDVIKPEVTGIKKELLNVKSKLEIIEENMKKKSVSPSRDEDPNDLGDLYIMDDELQNQIYGNQPSMYSNYGQPQTMPQTQRMHTPNALLNQPPIQHQLPSQQHHQQQTQSTIPYNNSSIYNPNFSMNYFPQYVMPGSHPAQSNLPSQRSALGINQHTMPFVDHPLNFNLPVAPQPPSIAQQVQLPTQDSRTNIFGLLPQTTIAPEKLVQSVVNSSTSGNIWNRLYNNGPIEKSPPVNVVITSSDPLPTNTTMLTQPTLSVTIPPHHIKPSVVSTDQMFYLPSQQPLHQQQQQQQHNTNFPIVTNTITNATTISSGSSVLSPISVSSLSSTTKSSKEQQQQPLKLLEVNANSTSESIGSDTHNKSTESEYDPRPDFQPVIPLPKEIEVKTGEEDEEVLFCSRAKLFRYVDKEWKERGLGDMKILKNKMDGKVRILMRREQTHKICANHIIIGEMNLTQAKNEERSYIWAANDFADEEVKVEKLCVRFKHVETAKEFYNVFKKARDEAMQEKNSNKTDKNKKESDNTKQVIFNPVTNAATFDFAKMNTIKKSDTVTSSSGLTFGSKTIFSTSTPMTAAKETTTTTAESESYSLANFYFPSATTESSSKPFANLFTSLNKTQQQQQQQQQQLQQQQQQPQPQLVDTLNRSNSDAEDEYVPTAQFRPVIPLPELVDVQTGEENDIVLFEHRAKLLRFDKQNSEWKERGIGNIKLLMDKEDPNVVRLLMRREIVHKLCCNQRLTKNMKFKKAPNTDCALSWCGQDYSENELSTEFLTIRFKTPEICKAFHDAVLKAQDNMRDVSDGSTTKSANKVSQQGFGDQFKPKLGSWNCSACYLQNENTAKECIACGSVKDIEGKKKEENKKIDSSTTNFEKKFEGFGDKFKPKAGSWNCSACYLPNESNANECIACGSPKMGNILNKNDETKKPQNTFTFGVDGAKSNKPTEGFGDKFKPQPGSWNCKACYLSNTSDNLYCVACKNPKDETVPKKTTQIQGGKTGLSAPTATFKFGFLSNAETKTDSSNNGFDVTTTAGKFSFGIPATAVTSNVTQSISPASTYTFGKLTSTAPTFSFGTLGGGGAMESNKLQTSTFSTSTTSTTIGGTQSIGNETNNTTQPTNLSSTFQFSSPSTTIFNIPKSNEPNKTNTPLSTTTSTLDKPDKLDSVEQNEDKNDNVFKLEKKEFNFVMKPKSPGKVKSPLKSGGEEESDEENVEEENNSYFTPVIPLPDKVDVKTGEENEEELYCHRAKLYRFVEVEKKMEWKERGIGNVKILRHKETGKLRVVMRREQVLKICLNHVLTPEVEYKRKDEKSWHFIVNDFSEGEIEIMHFCLRFKNKEIADEFMVAINKALNTHGSEEISNEDKNLADKLKLPYKFFDDKSTQECTGCRGCDPDNFVFPDYQNVNRDLLDENENPLPLDLHLEETSDKLKNSILKQSSLSFVTSPQNNNESGKITLANIQNNQFDDNVKRISEKNKNTFVFSLDDKVDKEKSGSLFGSSCNSLTDITKPIFGNALLGVSPNITSTSATSFSFGFGKSTAATQEGEPPKTETTFSFNAFGGTNTGPNIFGQPNQIISKPSEGGNASKQSFSLGNIFAGANNFEANSTGTNNFGTPMNTIKSGQEIAPLTKSVSGFSFGNVFGGSSSNNNETKSSGIIFGKNFNTTPKSIDQTTKVPITTAAVTNTSDAVSNNAEITTEQKQRAANGPEINVLSSAPATIDNKKTNESNISNFGDNITSSTTKNEKTFLFGSGSTFAFGGNKPFAEVTPTFGTGNLIGSKIEENKNDNKLPSMESSKNSTAATTTTTTPENAASTSTKPPKSEVASSSTTDTKDELQDQQQAVFKLKEDVSFAALASLKEKGIFHTKENTSGYIGLTDTNAFSSFLSSKAAAASDKEKDTLNSSLGDSTQQQQQHDDNTYDPHYDPIVPLPKEIEVKTGEEDEEKLFGERGTLFRYDGTSKEWKERGVGEMKILYHPKQGTYRLLLRREAIHKLVLNHAITADLNLSPMGKNGKAFLWAAQNFAEETPQVEKLAIRFKNPDIGGRFEKVIQQCIEDLSKRSNLHTDED